VTPVPIEKIRKLLELAAHENTPQDEARNSAVKACKLIVEHKLELVAPAGGQRLWTPEDGLPFETLWEEIFGRRPGYRPPPSRQTYSALCPELLSLRCTCCAMPVRVGTRFVYVSEPLITGPENKETIARVVHEACVGHWQHDTCPACDKGTRRPRNVRERLKNQRRDPPGTVRAQSSGFCYCCGSPYDVDEKVVMRGYAVVHAQCFVHFTKSPCPKCGGGARF
jgi:hypothetical protein